MEAKEFLNKARETISSNPIERLSSKTREIVESDNYIADIHCHFFDIKTINIKYFILRFIKDKLGLRDDEKIYLGNDPNIKYLNTSYEDIYNQNNLNNYFDTDKDWSNFYNELEYMRDNNVSLNDQSKTKRGIIDVIKNMKLLKLKSMREVYNFYLKKYGLIQYKELGLDNKKLIVTALMMDLESGWEISLRKGLNEQIEELKALSKEEPVLPFFSIDPRRTDLYHLFLKAFTPVSNSFFGVKVYPGLGYLPSDYRLLPIYEICQEKNIPILTHCGGEAVTTHHLELKAYRENTEIFITGKKRQEVAAQLNHPKEWIPVLERYKNLKLNLGHSGGDEAWIEYREKGRSEKITTMLEMMEKYKGVYADFSFNIIDRSLYSIYLTAIDAYEIMRERSLYGSDFWVVCGSGNLRKRQKNFLTIIDDHLPMMTYENVKRYLFYQG